MKTYLYKLTLITLFFCYQCLVSFATVPPLRQQISLNGTWDNGLVVPQYFGIEKFNQQSFQRTVNVPASWKGKVIKIEFGAVNFIADVFINGKHVMNHVGGWNAFAIDISKLSIPGKSFVLKVDVKGAKHQPIADANGIVQWPVGGWKSKGGIADDIWLRAYGEVYLENTYIKTSFRQKKLAVDYRIINTSTSPRTIQIESNVIHGKTAATAIQFNAPVITLAPGEVKILKAVYEWGNPELWWPDNPMLYHLQSRIVENKKTVDTETRRFGFREFWVEGNQFKLNGVRVNLFGDYQSLGDHWYTKPEIHTVQNWPQTVDKIKAMNIRILRFHHNPVPQYVLDITDEKGLLVCDESANYARDFHKKTNHEAYIKNFKTWVIPWIEADRNHPSVYMWNATNEMTYGFAGSFNADELRQFGNTIHAIDSTRSIGYDGDGDVGTLIDYHYPEGYNQEPAGSIYSWNSLINPVKPTGSGEVMHTKSPIAEAKVAVERNTWWLGIWSRGLRYSNFTNVKPACFWFTQDDLKSTDSLRRMRSINLRNAYAPVALFDKGYDDLGISPFVTETTPGGILPTVEHGVVLRRPLILYNDEFRDTSVRVEIQIKSDGKTLAKGDKIVVVPLGEHKEITCTFQVPFGIKKMDLVLSTFKNGIKKFEETRQFNVTGRFPIKARIRDEIIISEGYMPDFRSDGKYRLRPLKANED